MELIQINHEELLENVDHIELLENRYSDKVYTTELGDFFTVQLDNDGHCILISFEDFIIGEFQIHNPLSCSKISKSMITHIYKLMDELSKL